MKIKMKKQNKQLFIKKIIEKNISENTASKLLDVANSGYPNGSPWTKEQFSDTLNTKNTHVYGAFIHKEGHTEQLVGFLIAVDTKVEMDIYMVAIREAFKNQQIGGQLFEELIEDAMKIGIGEIYLEVRKSNVPAIRLYQRMNFVEIGERKNYYINPVEDALLMRLDLDGEKSE